MDNSGIAFMESMVEKCSVCSWTGEDAVLKGHIITLELIKSGIEKLNKMPIIEWVDKYVIRLLSCPKCGSIVQSEYIKKGVDHG